MSKFVWFEYVSSDAPKAQAFYGELFNWKVKTLPLGTETYAMIEAGGDTIGGYTPTPAGTPVQPQWLSYLRVANAAESCAKAIALGGKVMKQPFAIGDIGIMAVVLDPAGGAFALWQTKDPESSGEFRGVDNTWCWNELLATDDNAAVSFYTALGGFTTSSMPEMPGYHVLESGGVPRGGIMKSPMPGMPQLWIPYVQVANAKSTIDRAKRLGATVTVDAMAVTAIGTIAVFADPQGATFGILQPAPASK